MALPIWNRLSWIPGYSHPPGSRRSQKAECVGRNHTEKNYFLTMPVISRCPNQSGEAAKSQRTTLGLSVFESQAKYSSSPLNLVSWDVSMSNSTLAWGRTQAALSPSCNGVTSPDPSFHPEVGKDTACFHKPSKAQNLWTSSEYDVNLGSKPGIITSGKGGQFSSPLLVLLLIVLFRSEIRFNPFRANGVTKCWVHCSHKY